MTEVNIGIDSEIGFGTSKIVYKVKQVEIAAFKLFTSNLPLDKLVIASIQPDSILVNDTKQTGIKLQKQKIKNKDYAYIQNNKRIEEIIYELILHQQYADNDMAPKLYKVTLKWFNQSKEDILIEDFLDNPYRHLNELFSKNFNDTNNSNYGVLKFYVLEERCGDGLTKNKNIEVDNDFNILVNNLINRMSYIGETLFTDFKPENSCPLYNEAGKLTNIIALDLDAKFTYKYDAIKTDFQNVTGLNISIEDIEQMCKDIMYLEYMFYLYYYYKPNGILEETKKQVEQVRTNILEFIKKRISNDKFLEIISFICYLTISEFNKFKNEQLAVVDEENKRNFDVLDIAFKFPLIHYIRLVFKDKNKNKDEDVDEFTNEQDIKDWFIRIPYKKLTDTIFKTTTGNLQTNTKEPTILPPDQIFIEEPVDETHGLVPSLDSDSENEVEVEDETSSLKYSPLEADEDAENDARFAYGNLKNYGGSIRRKNKSKLTKKRKVTKRKLTKRKKSVKRRFTKRRKH